jgi:ATP dependent DNA ligase domain
MDGSPQAPRGCLREPHAATSRSCPVTEDAATLYETWVGWGGEGIVLKEPTSIYRPGSRSPAWLKVKPKVMLEIVVTGGSSEPIQWGDWGLAVMLDIAYRHPRDGKIVEIRQAIRIRRDEPFTLQAGERAELVCWGVMPSGMLRHPLFVRSLVR